MENDQIKTKVRDFVCVELLRDQDCELPGDSPLFSSGLIDSFALAQIGVFIEQEFKVYIPDSDLTVANMDTIDEIVSNIQSRLVH
jgi:acyl carrier protein